MKTAVSDTGVERVTVAPAGGNEGLDDSLMVTRSWKKLYFYFCVGLQTEKQRQMTTSDLPLFS